jgi:hypothetical protein
LFIVKYEKCHLEKLFVDINTVTKLSVLQIKSQLYLYIKLAITLQFSCVFYRKYSVSEKSATSVSKMKKYSS